jgi:acyl carrier protein phosphodiesterase
MIEQLLFILGGISISVIGYFLKRTLDELEKVKVISYENKNRLSVIENDYLNKVANLNDRFDLLYDAMKDLTNEIKELNKRFIHS